MAVYIYFKFTFQKSSIFGNSLLKKPVNWFAITKICDKQLKDIEILNKTTCVLT